MRASQPMSPLSLLPTAAEVLVHQWTLQNFKLTPTELLTTCSTSRCPQTSRDRVLLHQNEVNEATSVAKAKIVHSWEVLDAKVGCSRSVLEAKCNYRVAAKEAKMIRGNLLQKSEVAYSKAISKATALRLSQSAALHREHMRLMQELEEQALGEESKSCHDFLSACQATLYHTPQPLRENLATSYHVLFGQSSPSSPSVLPTKAPPREEQPPAATPISCHDFLSACQATLYHTLQPPRENLATSYHVLLG